MNAEKTEEQRVREIKASCYGCGAVLAVGPNYPEGVPVPATVELWCPHCHVISWYNIERKISSRAACQQAAIALKCGVVIMPINLGRETFELVRAPERQFCSCGCREVIEKGQAVHARKQEGRGRGYNRILDLEDHYRAWLERAARQYAAARAVHDPAFANYLGGRR